MRPLFADGFNSFVHVASGWFAYDVPVVGIVSVAYQLVTPPSNMLVDLGEIAVGYLAHILYQQG